jgi:dTDP-4-dehydrorhamnose reductase
LLVTGAAGMLGQEVVAAAERLGHEVAGWDLPECDLTDERATLDAVRRLEPRAVVNCAAYTNVDKAEIDEATAERVNADAAGNLARACRAAGARLVHVSTDYVFDGTKRTPYVESDAPDPLGAYGRTKLHGEAAAGEQAWIVRTAWLFGPTGHNFVRTMLRLGAERDEVAVVDDQRGCPTYVGHLSTAIPAVLELPYGVYHLAAGGECTWADFAEAIFEDSGVECRVRRITTAEFGARAPRPAYSVLRSEKGAPELPHWRDGLRECLARIRR